MAVVSLIASLDRGFGSTKGPVLANPGLQAIRLVGSQENTRVTIRSVSASSIPTGAPLASTVIPVWIFRCPPSVMNRADGIGIFTEVDPPTLLGNEGMPFWPLMPAQYEPLYLGYVNSQNVNGRTLKIPDGCVYAQAGMAIAVIAFCMVDTSLNPPSLAGAALNLTVLGTERSIQGSAGPSVDSRFTRSLPRFGN